MHQHVLLVMDASEVAPGHQAESPSMSGAAHLQGLSILPRELRRDLLCGWLRVLKTCIAMCVQQLQDFSRCL